MKIDAPLEKYAREMREGNEWSSWHLPSACNKPSRFTLAMQRRSRTPKRIKSIRVRAASWEEDELAWKFTYTPLHGVKQIESLLKGNNFFYSKLKSMEFCLDFISIHYEWVKFLSFLRLKYSDTLKVFFTIIVQPDEATEIGFIKGLRGFWRSKVGLFPPV